MAVILVTLAQGIVTTSGTEISASNGTATATSVDRVTKVFISAPAANTGTIYVGDSDVSTTRGIPIVKGNSLEIASQGDEYINLAGIWIDAATNGDKFQISYLKKVSS